MQVMVLSEIVALALVWLSTAIAQSWTSSALIAGLSGRKALQVLKAPFIMIWYKFGEMIFFFE